MKKMQLSTVALAISIGLAMPAMANTNVMMLDIKPQPLEMTLNQLASESNMTLIFEPELVDSLNAPELQGPATVRDALNQVLQNTGITATIEGNSIILKKLDSSKSSTDLAALSVVGGYVAPGMFDEDSVAAEDLPYLKTSSNVQLDSQYVEQFRGTSAGDMLKGIPGVEVGESRNGGAIDVNIRGVQGQNRVPVVIDGSIQSNTVYRGYAGVSDRAYIDPDLISTVSIDKGPANNAQGMGAVGGVVVMETLKTADILRDGEHHGVRLKVGMQSNSIDAQDKFAAIPRTDAPSLVASDGEFANIAYATEQDGFDLVLAASRRDIGNYFAGEKGREDYFYDEEKSRWNEVDGAWVEEKYTEVNEGIARFYKPGEEVLNTANKSTSLLIKPTLKINADSKLELSYRKYQAEYGEIMASQIFRNDGDTLMQWKPSKQSIDSYSARYKYASPTNPLLHNLNINLWHTETDSAAYNGFAFGNPLEGKEPPAGYECESCIDVYYLAKTASLRSGFDISNQSIFNSERFGTTTLDYGYSFQKESVGKGDGVKYSQDDIQNNRTHRDGDRYESSVFLQAKWSPIDWLSLELGGRYSWFKVHDNNANWVEDTKKYKNITLFGDDGSSLGDVRWFRDENGEYSDITDPRLTGVGMVEKWGEEPSDISSINFESSYVGGYEYGLSLGTFTVGDKMSRKHDGFAPNIALNMQLNESWLAYARYSEALRMPSIMESTLGWSVSRRIFDVDPERAKNKEIGLSYLNDELVDDLVLRAKVVYFDNQIKNYITRRSVDKELIESTDVSLAIGNSDSFNTSGIELQTRLEYGNFYGDVSATYYTEAKLCDAELAQSFLDNPMISWKKVDIPNCSSSGFSGMYVSNHIPPKKSVAAILGFKWLNGAGDIGMRMTYTGAPDTSYDRQSSWQNYHGTAPHIPTEAYTLVDIYARYAITDNMDVNFNIANLTNEFYLDALALSLMPGPGRTSRLTFTAHF